MSEIDYSRFTEPPILSVEELDDRMADPSPEVVQAIQNLDGDLMILGVGGKMGPSLAMLARNASEKAGGKKRIIGVDLFPDEAPRKALEARGIETLRCDMLNREELSGLPDIPNIVYMAGRKFGSTGSEWVTWAVNTYLPGVVADRFPKARIVAFSTGNIYPFSDTSGGGADESVPPSPLGEYAMSCLGRERILEHFAVRNGTPLLIFRLNYAIDLRYGILLDVAQKVRGKIPINLEMGHVNVIWQGDANERVLRSFPLCGVPPRKLNVTGPEVVSIRKLALRFGELFELEPIFEGRESPTALLNDAAESFRIFGYPSVPLNRMIEWVAFWVLSGGATLNKPTHFNERGGKF